jgi:HAD superfamily 5'-nucleotidase-like hydrolase
MPAALAFARIVDSIDLEKGGRQKKYSVWPDILDGLMAMYSRELFDTNESEYFVGLKNNPAKFVYKCEQKTLDWLKMLKEKKTTFLVTGSHVDFATLTAGHAIGPNWREYFDAIVCYSKKPGFFTMNRPFMQLDGIKETDPIDVADMQPSTVYTQGNFKDLRKFMARLSNQQNPKVVYVGDNLIQDVFTPNKHMNLDTIAIVEEMLCEGVDYNENYEILRSNAWGSYFHTNGEDTLWEKIVRKHAKICVPSVDVLASHPIEHKYSAFDPTDHSSCGYHPHDPFDPYTSQ